MKILICGSRNWKNETLIKNELLKFPKITTIIHGGCRGADIIAGKLATDLGFQVIEIKANWMLYKKAAGPIRNYEMLNKKPDKVIAFHSNIKQSKGTLNMINLAKKKNIAIKIIGEQI